MVVRQRCESKVTVLHDLLHFCKLQCLILLSLWMQNVQKSLWFNFQKFFSQTGMPNKLFSNVKASEKQKILLNIFLS